MSSEDTGTETGGEAMGTTHDALAAQVRRLSEELGEARRAIDAAERRREIDLALVRAEAVDLETARLMTEAAVAGMTTPDVTLAITELRQRKPFLFKGAARRAGAMGPRAEVENPAARLAREAGSSGDRAAVLRYLRAKRGV